MVSLLLLVYLRVDKVGMDELALGRSGCGQSGNRP